MSKQTFLVSSAFIFGLMFMSAWNAYNTPSQYPQKRVGIIHDYMFQNASELCELHGGLHYIIKDTTINAKSTKRYDGDDYPCEDSYLVRCNDQTLIKQDTGIIWCFISEFQIEESFKQNE